MSQQKKSQRIIKATPKVQAGANDLEILNPDREIIIAGKKLVVREYGFIEGLSVRVQTKDFLNDLYIAMTSNTLSTETIMELVSIHSSVVLPVIAQSADVGMDFFAAISHGDGKSLIYLWWAVNGPFFLALVTDRIVGEIKEKQARVARAGQTSTQSSSQTDTTQNV